MDIQGTPCYPPPNLTSQISLPLLRRETTTLTVKHFKYFSLVSSRLASRRCRRSLTLLYLWCITIICQRGFRREINGASSGDPLRPLSRSRGRADILYGTRPGARAATNARVWAAARGHVLLVVNGAHRRGVAQVTRKSTMTFGLSIRSQRGPPNHGAR